MILKIFRADAQEKQLKDRAIKNWLHKLNAAAYKIDDILDECKNEAARLGQSRLGCCQPEIITFRHKIGKRMKEMMEKLDAIAKERMDFHFHEKIIEGQTARRETGFVLTELQVYGRDKEEDEIVKILINNISAAQELSVLPIVGMGGLGKTTLAQMVFNDQRVTEHFYPKIWICVSNDFDEKRLIKTIVESIEGRPLLDDVWNEDQQKWANLRQVLKVGASGAFVLTTTRLEKVGSIMGTLQPYELSNLSQENCWLLSMQCAFGYQEEINPNLVAIGKEIVKKCSGVPLAAKNLGGLLCFKKESEWELVKDSEIWNLCDEENTIFPALQLSYHHLPLYLRQCFVYCAVFPKDAQIEKERLISLWIAHNFLLLRGKLEQEDVGNEVWNELCLRSFFQEIEVKSAKTYFKMHDLIHDLATSLFSASTSSSNIREIKIEGYKSNMLMSIGFAEVVSFYSPPPLKKFISLRELNLCYSNFEKLPSSIGDLDLTCLKTLDLFVVSERKGCQLGELRNLNLYGSISLRHHERVKNDKDGKEANLSAEGNLHSLSMHWDIDEPHRYESEEVKVLESLKPHPNLKCFKNCSFLPPFGDLPCLESLELCSGSAEVEYVDSGFPTRRRFPSLRKLNIDKFCNLKGLLEKEGEEQFPVLEEMSIYWCPMFVIPVLSSIKKLHVYGADATGLRSISNLRALTSLDISNNEEATSIPEEMFKSLANLKYLNISSYYNLKELPTSLACLNALKHLKIHNCVALESLPEEGVEGLTSLSELSVHNCKMLKCLPEGLQHLTSLTTLTVGECLTLIKRCEKGIGETGSKLLTLRI
ncbi:hypothetical protein KY290_034433 [Solanum tuberosum]|uniref:Disease resistance protein RGA3 n=1 Tax=Solanum tuberosum TaxID=4113 RepID=A0ABQ7U3K1_SOLTU|nr:hypothetical protein KY290_034433 [Solanum tuberosum]